MHELKQCIVRFNCVESPNNSERQEQHPVIIKTQ